MHQGYLCQCPFGVLEAIYYSKWETDNQVQSQNSAVRQEAESVEGFHQKIPPKPVIKSNTYVDRKIFTHEDKNKQIQKECFIPSGRTAPTFVRTE